MSDSSTYEAIQSQAEIELRRQLSENEKRALKKYTSPHKLLEQIERYGFGFLKFFVITVGHPYLHCMASPNITPPDGNCLMHAVADIMLQKEAKKTRDANVQERISADLSRDLRIYNFSGHNTTVLRKRWVLGASDWLAGKHGSLNNLKNIFQYTDDEWNFVWSTMICDKAWNVSGLKDLAGNVIKENFGPEMLIRYIAHDIRCHIIVFDLQLEVLQFCSGNYLKDNNVIDSSPLLMYCTGSHFQSLHPKYPEYFCELAAKLESGEDGLTKLSYIDDIAFDEHQQFSKRNSKIGISEQSISLNTKSTMSFAEIVKQGKHFSCDVEFEPMKSTKKNQSILLTKAFKTYDQQEESLSGNTLSLEQLKMIKNKTLEQKKMYEKLRKQEQRERQTMSDRLIQNEKDKERKANKRKNLTPSEKQIENVKDAARKAAFNQNLTPSEREKQNAKDADRKANKRKKLTPSEKQMQNVKDAERMAAFNQNLTPSERENQNAKDADRMANKRKKLTPSEKQMQNVKDAERKAAFNQNLTPSKRENQNAKDADRMANKRKKLTPSELLKQNNKDAKRKANAKQNMLKQKCAVDRVAKFKQAVRFGPIFPCCSCEQLMFENGVMKLEGITLASIQSTCAQNENKLFQQVFGDKLTTSKFKVAVYENEESYYICYTCKKHLMRGKLPPMSAANSLSLKEVPEHLKLSDLENNLISKKILFQKLYQLPISRMAAFKDKLVNVPIEDTDIINTLESLPRTPADGGLIEIKLKRKVSYKNYHRQEFVNPQRLHAALKFFKDLGNPHYQFSSNPLEYRKRCEISDPNGFDLLFGDNHNDEVEKLPRHPEKCSVLFVDDKNSTWDEIMDLKDYIEFLEEEISHEEEIHYRTNDPIRRFQIDYDKDVCLAEKFPEAFYSENYQNNLNDRCCVAPGEGKIPENILTSQNWDALAFPMKHPDGKNNLHEKRETQLSDQYYFVQRMRNKDPRFRRDSSYLFACAAYLEKKQFQRNINVAFMRGKKAEGASGDSIYSLEDGFSVFDSTSNTPTYWKKAKYEMMAKLDNLGPFHFFFTLSCADKLWMENITTILEEKKIKVIYGFDSEGNEETLVQVVRDSKSELVHLDEYIEQEMDESIHEILRRNVVTATRNYQHRVKAFIREVMTDSSNPMLVKHFSAKLEFQGRGAAHNHGTIWIDKDRMEFMMEKEVTDKEGSKIEYNIFDFNLLFGKDSNENVSKSEVKWAVENILKSIHPQTLNESQDSERARQIVVQFAKEKLNICVVNESEIISKFRFVGMNTAFKKIQSQDHLLEYEEQALINLANAFTTVSLSPAVVSEKVVDIVRAVNVHKHTKACRKYSTKCRFNFPKFPIWKTIIAHPNKIKLNHDISLCKKILDDISEAMMDSELINRIMSSFDKQTESIDDYVKNREERIKMLLSAAGYKTENDWDLYLSALSVTKSGYSLVMARDIDEIFVNSYNPEWILAWNGNIDLQICLDFFAIITYITEYFTKDDTGTMSILLDALKNADCPTLKEKMILMMNTFITHRQMGEAEAIYKIFPDFHFKESSISSVFFPNCPQEERSKFLIRADDKPQYAHMPKVKIENREGEFVEQYDIVSKYQRREGLDEICAAQFTKMYEPSWKGPKKEQIENKERIIENKFHFVMTRCDNLQGEFLPQTIQLLNTFPNEPPFMRKRTFPAALRIHKFNRNTDSRKYFFSECLLYTPFRDEREIWKRLEGNISELENDIRIVKSQAMEYLESNDEARLYVEEMNNNEETANELDPQGQQELEDCEIEGQVLHPEFDHLNPEHLGFEDGTLNSEKCFKPIEIDEKSVLLNKTKGLDFYQRKVVERGISYSRELVKSLKEKNSFPSPPQTIVIGGAGSGKSTVINILKQWIHLILKKEGDNPDCPYVIVTAPTGTAAANIRGQTLHSALSFNFGNKHYSLSDKKRDKMRSLFQNLKVIIIDEISMIKADLLYQLDLRLREITNKKNKLFGGISIFFFGDIMQLRPCKGTFIFDEPLCKDYLPQYLCKTLWDTFDVILLEENHRQGEDHSYAEILNRIRIGQQTDSDMDVLRERVRPEGHPDLKGAMYVTCTNKTVMKMNDIRLKELDSELFEIQARHAHPTIKEFVPKVDAKGTVGGTSFLQTLKVKIGSRVMLIHNIDVLDGMSNGSRGTLIGIERNTKNEIQILIVKFDEQYQGANKRMKFPHFTRKYPGGTPIEKFLYPYSLAKKTTVAASTAQVYQFPMTVCFAATTHKFQGATVVKPNNLAVDLRTVFDDAMAYVMVSRVQAKLQLFVVGDLPEAKFRTSSKCLGELENLSKRSVNKNPPSWECLSKKALRISVLNCHSLKDKINHIKSDKMLLFSDLICLTETWLDDHDISQDLKIPGYNLHRNNCVHPRGKGVAIYQNEMECTVINVAKLDNLQITLVSLAKIDVFVVYRSSNCSLKTAVDIISSIINPQKSVLVCGDLNICFKEFPNNGLIRFFMSHGFEQKVQKATHIEGGLLDQVYFKNGKQNININVSLYSPYYNANDHDALCIEVNVPVDKIENKIYIG